MKTCTICHEPIHSARFTDRTTGAHMHVSCLAGWFSSQRRPLKPSVSSREPVRRSPAVPAPTELAA